MKSATPGDWLQTTVAAVREVMVKRLAAPSLQGDERREMEMALEELDVMWEELQGQAALLMRENERYAEFFEHAPDAYVITDAGGSVREANRAALELLQATRDAVVGATLARFVVDDERVGFLARSVGLMVGEAKPASWQASLRRAAGPPLMAEFTVRGIPLRKSGIGGLCWLIRRLD